MNLQTLDDAALVQVLRCTTPEVAGFRAALGNAASEEYANIFTGTYAATSASAAREYRLYLIIKHAYAASLPSPEVIGSLFRMPSAQGRILLGSVLRKYADELKDSTRATFKTVLQNATFKQKAYRFSSDAGYLVAAMNAELPALSMTLNKELHRISLMPGTASIYKVPDETRTALLGL